MKAERIGWWRALFTERLPRCYRASDLQAFTIAGDCLRPWLLPGDVVLVDPTLDPVDGELVLVNMKYRRSGVMIGAGVTYRVEPAIKQLVLVNDSPMLACASGAVRAERHDIVGPVVAVSRRGWRRAPMTSINFRGVMARSRDRAQRRNGNHRALIASPLMPRSSSIARLEVCSAWKDSARFPRSS